MAGRPPRYNVSARTASSDSRYWGRYWNGDRPILYSALRSTAGQTNALTTGIRLGSSLSATYGLTGNLATGSGVDAYGIGTYAVSSLITGINGTGITINDNTSGAATATWTSDGTGNFARIQWPIGGGNIGIGWDVADTTKRGIYIRYKYRRWFADHSKRLKYFGNGYPTNYSNCTHAVDYSGQARAFAFSDKTTGGDIDVEYFYGSYPTLTGGSNYSQTPHPTKQVDVAYNEPIDGTWILCEEWFQHSTDGNNDGEKWSAVDGVTKTYLSNAYTCRTGGQGFVRVSLGDYLQSNAAIVYEDFKEVYISYDRPVGRGLI